MKHTTVTTVEVSANMGSVLGYAMQDALEIAVKEWRNVNLKHDGKIYEVLINDLVSCFKERK